MLFAFFPGNVGTAPPPPTRDLARRLESKKQAFQTSWWLHKWRFHSLKESRVSSDMKLDWVAGKNLICALREALKSELGEAWNRLPAQKAAEAVIHLPDWDDCLNLSVDFGLLVVSIDAAMKDQGEWPAQPPCVGLTHIKPGVTRHRLYFK